MYLFVDLPIKICEIKIMGRFDMSINEKNVIVEAFSELAPTYEQTIDRELKQFWGVSYQSFVERLTKSADIKPGDKVLDVATGTAAIPLHIADKVGTSGKVVGLDLTLAMLERGKAKLAMHIPDNGISLVCASAMTTPYTDNYFDVGICCLGMHHMDAPTLLSEMHRILKPGGKLVMADVGATSFWRSAIGVLVLKILMYGYGISQNGNRAQAEIDAFPNVRTMDEWCSLLTEMDFKDIDIIEAKARRPWYPSGLIMKAFAGYNGHQRVHKNSSTTMKTNSWEV